MENPSLNSNKDAMNALPMDMDVQKVLAISNFDTSNRSNRPR